MVLKTLSTQMAEIRITCSLLGNFRKENNLFTQPFNIIDRNEVLHCSVYLGKSGVSPLFHLPCAGLLLQLAKKFRRI